MSFDDLQVFFFSVSRCAANAVMFAACLQLVVVAI